MGTITVNFPELTTIMNDCYIPLIDSKDENLIFYGGYGSGKSYFIAQRWVMNYLRFPGRNLLAVRKAATHARRSIYNLFKQIISEWDLYRHFDFREQEMTVIFPNGNRIVVAGVDDPENLKSITLPSGDFTDGWAEEVTELTFDEYTKFSLRVRGKNTPGVWYQKIMSFNPISISHWIKREFFDNPSEHVAGNTIAIHTTYQDNKFLNDDYRRTLEDLKNTNPDLYMIACIGEWGTTGKQIYENVDFVDSIPEGPKKVYYGIDWGYSIDPACIVRVTEMGDDFYLECMIYEEGLTNDDLVKMGLALGIDPYAEIYADSAEPKSIEEAARAGFKGIRECRKGPGSVKTGIDLLKSLRLHIVKVFEWQSAKREKEMYQWKKDRNGEYMPVPIDMFNHFWDGARYPIFTRRQGTGSLKMLKF